MTQITSEQKHALKQGLRAFDIVLPEEQIEQLLLFQRLVNHKNQFINLTRITSMDDAIILNLVDSLTLLPQVMSKDGPFLDMGTGAGIPGVPLAIASGQRATLIDSVAKKIACVQEFVEQLGMSGRVKTVADRLENFALTHKGEFTTVTARAVASGDVLLEYARPLLMHGGKLILAKANVQKEEFDRIESVCNTLGFDAVSRETFELPQEMGHREVLTFQVVAESKIALPRAVGEAKNKPLSAQ
jgi:16S rRNA (guanine527-N7)-methyltransferase